MHRITSFIPKRNRTIAGKSPAALTRREFVGTTGALAAFSLAILSAPATTRFLIQAAHSSRDRLHSRRSPLAVLDFSVSNEVQGHSAQRVADLIAASWPGARRRTNVPRIGLALPVLFGRLHRFNSGQRDIFEAELELELAVPGQPSRYFNVGVQQIPDASNLETRKAGLVRLAQEVTDWLTSALPPNSRVPESLLT